MTFDFEPINAALRADNPFESSHVATRRGSLPDIPSLNAHASDAVLSALSKVAHAESTLDKITSLVIEADSGYGKSHVIKRLETQLKVQGDTIFISANVGRYGHADMVNSCFQQSIAESLEQETDRGFTQGQELAAAMIQRVIRLSNSSANVPGIETITKKFDRAYKHQKTNISDGSDLISKFSKQILQIHRHLDPHLIRAILWTLSEENSAYALKWLSGEEIAHQDAIDLRLPNQKLSDIEKETRAINNSIGLLSLMGEYKRVLVCFDELDALVTEPDCGFPPPIIISNLVKELFDSVQQSATGLGIVFSLFMLPNDFKMVGQTYKSHIARISAYSPPVRIGSIPAESLLELVQLWMTHYYEQKELTISENIYYPFDEDELRKYAREGHSVREALAWCAENLPKKIPAPQKGETQRTVSEPSPTERMKAAYEIGLQKAWDPDDNDAIASVLEFCFGRIISIPRLKRQAIERTIITAVEEISPRYKNNDYLHFKVVGEEASEPVIIGIAVVQQTHGLSVGARFRRLIDYETFGFTRGCVVRSKERKIKRTWDSSEYYQRLVEQGGEWVDLQEAQIRPLIALKYVYDHCADYQLTEKQLDSFAFPREILTENPLLREILSNPMSQVDEAALEGEVPQRLHTGEAVVQASENLDVFDDLMVEETEEQPDLSALFDDAA